MIKAELTKTPIEAREAIAEKTACELESYPEQGVQYLEELKTILNEEGSDYAT